MRHTSAIFAGLVAIGLSCAEPARAQFLPYPQLAEMPPHEVAALVSSAGLKPLGRPVRRGPAYVLQAVTPAGREVRVIVDARLRRIARVVAVAPARAADADAPPPAPYGRPPGDIAAAPEVRGPGARAGGLPPDANAAEPYGPSGQQPYGQVAAVGATPVVPNRPPIAGAEPGTTRSAPPPLPLPRPRPQLAANEAVAPMSDATGTAVAPAAPVQRDGISAAVAAAIAAHEPVYEEQE